MGDYFQDRGLSVEGLTGIQQDVLDHIKAYKAEHDGMSPTREEMAKHFNVSATAIAGTLKLIEKKGYIKLYDNIPRSIRVIK